MRDGELNGDHVHTLEDLWMGRITVRHLEPGIYSPLGYTAPSKPAPFVEATFYHVVPHTEEVRHRDLLSQKFWPNLAP